MAKTLVAYFSAIIVLTIDESHIENLTCNMLYAIIAKHNKVEQRC